MDSLSPWTDVAVLCRRPCAHGGPSVFATKARVCEEAWVRVSKDQLTVYSREARDTRRFPSGAFSHIFARGLRGKKERPRSCSDLAMELGHHRLNRSPHTWRPLRWTLRRLKHFDAITAKVALVARLSISHFSHLMIM